LQLDERSSYDGKVPREWIVRDMMSRHPAKIGPGATVREAAEMVSEARCSDLMVAEADGTFVGVLSEGDLIRTVLPRFDELSGQSLVDAFGLVQAKGLQLAGQLIDPLVIRRPVTLSPDETGLRAANVMIARQIRQLPVVEAGRLVGSLSRADLCRALLLG
jgi:CBS domain-containing protein